MNKKLSAVIVLAAVSLAGIALLSVIRKKPDKVAGVKTAAEEPRPAASPAKDEIVVPKNVKKVTPRDREEYLNADCSASAQNVVCDYFVKSDITTGKKEIRNSQWPSLCVYAKLYGETGKYMLGQNLEFETLGYEDGPCYQGKYAGK